MNVFKEFHILYQEATVIVNLKDINSQFKHPIIKIQISEQKQHFIRKLITII